MTSTAAAEGITNTPAKKTKQRLLSLDILRGLTVAGMILVNNPGTWGSIYAPLRHAEWHGLTPTDLVFPFFMFIMGVSTYFSLRKYDFQFSWQALGKILKRSVLILLIGWAIAWFAIFLRGMSNPEMTPMEAIFNFSHIRFLGVLPRLAICYGVSSLIAISVKHKYVAWIVALLLAIYTLMLVIGNGFEFSDRNVISIVDHKVLGADHMYGDTIDGVTLKFDPEGLLSTLPSIAHCLIGFLCGMMIVKVKDNGKRSHNLLIIGALLTFAGFLLSYGCPINKKIWSPTFVLTTCGLASTLLGLFIWIIDIKHKKKWCTFFEVFGVNPLFLYALSSVLAILFGFIKIPMAAASSGYASIHTLIYQYFLVPACADNAMLASLLYAIIFVLINWSVGLILYKKKIYIKL